MKPSTAPSIEDQFGRIVARTLSANLEQMPYEVQERLRAARMRAVAARRVGPILVAQTEVQYDYRANEVAEVDSALLTDDLPPHAYTDPGFLHFLKLQSVDSTQD